MSNGGLREKYFDRLRFAKRSELTIKQYGRKLAKLHEYMMEKHGLSLDSEDDVRQIKGWMLSEFQESLRAGGMSLENEATFVRAIKSFFSVLGRLDFIDRDKNPADALMTVSVPQKEQPHLTWSEAETVIQKYTSRNELRDLAILGLAFTVALRVSAIVNLNIGDIDFEGRELKYINKGGARKTAYIPEEVARAIKRYVDEYRFYAEDDDPLFISERGERISTDAIRYICRKSSKIIGKKFTPHAARRTSISRANEIKGKELAQLFGAHTSGRTTARYIYTSSEQMDEVYERMKLFSFDSTKK
jgi:integrase